MSLRERWDALAETVSTDGMIRAIPWARRKLLMLPSRGRRGELRWVGGEATLTLSLGGVWDATVRLRSGTAYSMGGTAQQAIDTCDNVCLSMATEWAPWVQVAE